MLGVRPSPEAGGAVTAKLAELWEDPQPADSSLPALPSDGDMGTCQQARAWPQGEEEGGRSRRSQGCCRGEPIRTRVPGRPGCGQGAWLGGISSHQC